MTDKETIISLLNEFANPEKMASFFIKNATFDFLFIRPSGNPINAEGFEKMISSDVVQEKAEITKIHRLEFLNDNNLFRFPLIIALATIISVYK